MTPQRRKLQRLARQARATCLIQLALLLGVLGLMAWDYLGDAPTPLVIVGMIACGIVAMLVQAFYEVRIWPQQNDLRIRDDEV
ncbi:MAG TPA: hypothetical protein VGD88_06210 [Opitutaceae bacterium]